LTLRVQHINRMLQVKAESKGAEPLAPVFVAEKPYL
jgi:hypothetical protein